MKTIDSPENIADSVISEVRAIKRQIVAEHGGDLHSLFASIRKRQACNPRLVKSTQENKTVQETGTVPRGDR